MKRTENCLRKLERMNRTLRHQEADRVPVAVIRKKFSAPMPEYVSFGIDTLEKMAAVRFDDPWDERRFLKDGDNQVAGVGDGFARNLPPWVDTVRSLYPSFPERLGRFLVEMTRAQIKAADGLLDGMVIWGDVAYVNGMLFSPDFWRAHFKPIVPEQIRICHEAGLPVIYHGCGNASGDLRRISSRWAWIPTIPWRRNRGWTSWSSGGSYGHRMGFCGNMDVLAWANAPVEEVRRQVLRKLNAAKGGGYIFQSDHSVPSNVSAERYEYVVNLVRKHGTYPLQLGEFDDP